MRRIGIVAVIVGVAAACQPAETPEQMEARMAAEAEVATAALDAAYARMLSFVASENADSMASLYAENAKLYPADEPLVEGREAIRAKYVEWFGMGTAEFQNRRLGLTVNGPIAVERVTWSMKITGEPGGPVFEMTNTGKSVVVWQKVGDQWLILDDIGNNDKPMVPLAGGS
jgi:ketosteroid isomerase-like protein